MNTFLIETPRIVMMSLLTGEVSLPDRLMLLMANIKRKVKEHIFFVLKDNQQMKKTIL